MFRFSFSTRWSPEAARERLRKGKVPRRMRVAGHLDLSSCFWLTNLPRTLEAGSINVSNCPKLRTLPEHVECEVLILQQTNVECLHAGLNVARQIDAANCIRLRYVAPLSVSALLLSGCTTLQRLPDGLKVQHLDLSRCARFVELPASAAPYLRNLDVSGCTNLRELPAGLKRLATLNVRGCTNLKSLPSDIQIKDWLEVAESGLDRPLRFVQHRWRGTPVPDHVAFYPETIRAAEILWERNLELRRVLIERVGIDWFLEKANADVIDSDHDAGGPRRLLRISFGDGPDMVCVEVDCPSTGRKYILQVPPQMPTCAHAAAWLAGFNNPAHFRPVLET
jgi:hypothetical protein